MIFIPLNKIGLACCNKVIRTLLLASSALLSSLLFLGCSHDSLDPKAPPQLTLYSGITMAKPVLILAKEFEQKHAVKINVHQGGTGYLFRTIQSEQKGDLFFPGSQSYYQSNPSLALWGEKVQVGYNRLALIVKKDNPNQIPLELAQLANPKWSVVLSSPESGAIGRYTKAVLDQQELTQAVYKNTTYFTSDSDRIFKAFKQGHADLALNWLATAYFPKNKKVIDALPLAETLAPAKKLEIHQLTFSEHPQLARQFLRYASSQHGLQTFADYGFLTPKEMTHLLNNNPITASSNKGKP